MLTCTKIANAVILLFVSTLVLAHERVEDSLTLTFVVPEMVHINTEQPNKLVVETNLRAAYTVESVTDSDTGVTMVTFTAQ